MESFLRIIHCCRKEEMIDDQKKSEIKVPNDSNKIIYNNNIQNASFSQDKSDFRFMESSNIISTEINNAMTLNDNNNNNQNNNTIEDNSPINILNPIINAPNNNDNIIKNSSIKNQNINNNQKSINKVDTFSIQNPKESETISQRNNTNIIDNNHFSINKIINNNAANNNNDNSESKKNSSVNISISKNKNAKDSQSNKGTILTLNDLVLINQSQEDKFLEIGSKLLLSGELFFWKEIIVQTNGIKNSLRKDKDDHVFFGLKNKTNYAGVMYNDFIINYFWHQEDGDIIETNTGRVFEIYYNKKSKDYTLKFLHPNLILYYKINNFVYFNTGKEYYLLLGNVFMTINVKKTSPIEKTIILQVEIENNKPIKYSFTQNQTPIKIGRINNSEIPIFSSSVSKRHGIIEYSKNSQSFYYKDMGSTNSSTLLIKDGDNLKIKGEMNFKLEDVPFKIQEIP